MGHVRVRGVRLLRVMPVTNLNHQDNKAVGNIRQVDSRQLTMGYPERDIGERAAGLYMYFARKDLSG